MSNNANRPLRSVLIANRGEIACRILRTCRRLGLRGIAVYSEADRHARHVREADDAIRIGPADAANSYLRVDAIMHAAQKSNADAIHPGYGFLSEKTALPDACAAQGLIWIGPRRDVIAQMGSKIESKRIARQAGVTTVPGYDGDDQSVEILRDAAVQIGFPVLIKASAGGGGKGMRRVDRAADFAAALNVTQQESMRAFGDDRVLIEKLIERPRHLEVQLAGDQHGNLVHLFERECSVQRNYQKLIEEAPAAYLQPMVREKLFEAALKLGRAIRYDSLGTVEFVLDARGDQPHFLEMNTRLQVEHPVTEQVTGIDLVEWQLRIAAGESLPMTQEQIGVRGWAIEARINCENPADDFKAQLGAVTSYTEPMIDGLRVESGIDRHSEIGPHYDSMLAKLIGHGASRTGALQRLDAGLVQFEVVGPGTNQGFLRALLETPRFIEHALTTHYVSERFPDGWKPPARLHDLALAALGFCALQTAMQRMPAPAWSEWRGFRTMSAAGRKAWSTFIAHLDSGPVVEIHLRRAGNGWAVRLSGDAFEANFDMIDTQHLRIDDQEISTMFAIEHKARSESYCVSHQGMRWSARVRSKLEALADVGTAKPLPVGEVRASMPGVVVTVNVAKGQTVAAGELVATMESMKLVSQLSAGIAGTITGIECAAGVAVIKNQVLIRITP